MMVIVAAAICRLHDANVRNPGEMDLHGMPAPPGSIFSTSYFCVVWPQFGLALWNPRG